MCIYFSRTVALTTVAKEFESELLSIRHRRPSVSVRDLFKLEGGGIGVGARTCMLSNWCTCNKLFCLNHTEQEVDGMSFMELTMDELNRLFPDKLGTVKKLYRLIQSVS